MLRRIIESAGATPSNTIVVGDMEVDYEFGRAAGCRVVLIPGGSRTRRSWPVSSGRVSREHLGIASMDRTNRF